MKRVVLNIFAALLTLSLGAAAALAQEAASATRSAQGGAEQTLAAEQNVLVMLCLESGDITVRGWERSEVRARAGEGQLITLRRMDEARERPATNITVHAFAEGSNATRGGCRGFGRVELDVPRGASVNLRTSSGNIVLSNVAEAHVQTASGNIEARGLSRMLKAATVSGDLTVRDSAGGLHLNAVSGSVEVANVRPASPSDLLELQSVSGEMDLRGIGHARVRIATVTGSASLMGPLVAGGRYDFNTTTGTIALALAGDASFRLTATIAHGGDVMTDFPLQESGGSATQGVRRISGTHGGGDATINFQAFSGTLQLRRR